MNICYESVGLNCLDFVVLVDNEKPDLVEIFRWCERFFGLTCGQFQNDVF